MEIVSSIYPSEELQEDIKKQFPNVNFSFYKGMKEARESFYKAEVFVTYGEDLVEEDIYNAENLKWIMIMSAGMDRMPFKACAEKGILITNVRGIHKIPMAEFTLSQMLTYVKQTNTLLENERREVWDRKVPMGELADKTLLVLGIGAIGGEIARLAKAFRMNVIGVNRHGHPHEYADQTFKIGEMKKHLEKADFIVSVLPSTKETHYLLTEGHFKLMKKSAVFINIGRGNLIKDEVLLKVMQNQEVAHAYLDVFEQEPLPTGHPFWEMDTVTVTPHLSSITKKYMPRSFEIFKHNLHTYMNKSGEFINPIDPTRGY